MCKKDDAINELEPVHTESTVIPNKNILYPEHFELYKKKSSLKQYLVLLPFMPGHFRILFTRP